MWNTSQKLLLCSEKLWNIRNIERLKKLFKAYLKKILAQVFSCEFCESFNNTFIIEHLYYRTPLVAASVSAMCFVLQYSFLYYKFCLILLIISCLLYFNRKTKLKKGKHPNRICLNNLFDVTDASILKEI